MLAERPQTVVSALGVCILVAGGWGDTIYATAPPNIVLFLADDMGWTDWQYDATLNPTGSVVYETPNLLRLAQRSVNLTNAYAPSPVCSPTRSAILTGQSPARTRITNFLPGTPNTTANLMEPWDWQRILPGKATIPNMANLLNTNGYSTGLFGKWHLGNASVTQYYGFDVDVGGSDLGGPGDGTGGWFAGDDGMWPMPGLDTPGQFPANTYLSDAIADKAGDFVQAHANQPFFLADWTYQVHIPLQAPADLVSKYQNKINMLQGQGVNLKGHTNATYAAMVEKMDGDVGKMMARLDDPNQDGDKSDSILNNTIFVFSSDNGGDYDADGSPTRNLPLREGKGSLYEGGIRVPLMVSYGADTKIAQGTMSAARTSLYDLYPTLFDMAGLAGAMPANTPLDGVSIRSALEGETMDRGLLFWHYPHRSPQDVSSPLINGGAFVSAVANKDWKLIFFYDDRHYELYNITNDIGETTNVLADNPTVAHDLSLALHSYLVSVNAEMPISLSTYQAVAPPDILSTPVLGDYNGDAAVTMDDYLLWRANFGSTTRLAADGNGNGIVDAADYVIWRSVYLGSGGNASSVGNSVGIPEPSSSMLFVIALISLTGRFIRDSRRREKSFVINTWTA